MSWFGVLSAVLAASAACLALRPDRVMLLICGAMTLVIILARLVAGQIECERHRSVR